MEVFGPPTITLTKFTAVLAGSPALAERPAREYYATIAYYGLDPAFMLAIFKHESDCGRNPAAVVNRYGTKNWGNTRSLSLTPDANATVVDTDRGRFVKFPFWITGLRDACYRLVSPAYPYAQARARSVEAILPIWAPSGDAGNRPSAYVASVLANMAAWQKKEQPKVALTVREAIIPARNSNRPGLVMFPKYITIHETANTSVGANAEMHRKFLVNGGGPEGVSFHWVVDDREAVHLIPDEEVAWHAGDGTNGVGNRQSIAIEACVNSDGDFAVTLANLAQLVSTLLARHGIPLANVVQHNRWSGKDCPRTLRLGGWADLLSAIAAASPPAPPAAARPDGWLNAGDADVFKWEGEGVIVQRAVRYYNPTTDTYYDRVWSAEGGYNPWVQVQK